MLHNAAEDRLEVEAPPLTLADVGGMDDVKREVERTFLESDAKSRAAQDVPKVVARRSLCCTDLRAAGRRFWRVRSSASSVRTF